MVAQQPDVTGFSNQQIFLLFFFTFICLTLKKKNLKAFIQHVLHDGFKEKKSISLTTGPFNIFKQAFTERKQTSKHCTCSDVSPLTTRSKTNPLKRN